MPNPAFLVEGHMEQRFLSNVCPGQPVRRIGCNGDQVSMQGLAKHLETHIRLLPNNYPLVIIFDRERRVETCAQLELDLRADLKNRGVDNDSLIIGIADRTTENWILADRATLAQQYPKCAFPKGDDGDFGKSVLSKALKPVDIYNETTTGVSLLKSLNPQNARQHSVSLDDLLDQIKFDCWWLDQ